MKVYHADGRSFIGICHPWRQFCHNQRTRFMLQKGFAPSHISPKDELGSSLVGVSWNFKIIWWDDKNLLTPFLDNQPAIEMQAEIEKISIRFVEMENDAKATERIYFPTKKLWKIDDSEDLKYIRALKFILSEMRFTVPNIHKNLIYLILNVIFFNKNAKWFYPKVFFYLDMPIIGSFYFPVDNNIVEVRVQNINIDLFLRNNRVGCVIPMLISNFVWACKEAPVTQPSGRCIPLYLVSIIRLFWTLETVRGCTDLEGVRTLEKIERAWLSIPENAFELLLINQLQNYPNYTQNNLQESEANRYFRLNAGRGQRYAFDHSTMVLSTESPNYVLISIEIKYSWLLSIVQIVIISLFWPGPFRPHYFRLPLIHANIYLHCDYILHFFVFHV